MDAAETMLLWFDHADPGIFTTLTSPSETLAIKRFDRKRP